MGIIAFLGNQLFNIARIKAFLITVQSHKVNEILKLNPYYFKTLLSFAGRLSQQQIIDLGDVLYEMDLALKSVQTDLYRSYLDLFFFKWKNIIQNEM